jgi:hypothetical protein
LSWLKIEKKAKKPGNIFGRNKRVTTFVAPKEREQELRQKEEGLKPVWGVCRLHKEKNQGRSALGNKVLIFYGKKERVL